METQAANARVIADFLGSHPLVEKVYFLGTLEGTSSPQADIYKRQCLSAGAMLSFDIRGGEQEAFAFLDHLKLVKLAVSLGGTESLAQHPASMTHAGMEKELKDELGITDKMIRLSVGVENSADLVHDIQQALHAVESIVVSL